MSRVTTTLSVDPNAEEVYPDVLTPLKRRDANANTPGGSATKSKPRFQISPGGTRRPFRPISPSFLRATSRPFGSGKDTTDEQKYRRYKEIKDEIRKRAQKLEATTQNARAVHSRSVEQRRQRQLPPLTNPERFALFVNSFEFHSMIFVLFLVVLLSVGMGRAVQTATACQAALLCFWTGLRFHAGRTPKESWRLLEYSEISRNISIAPLVSLSV